ncbi:MAG: alpha/beta hydrolase-fold protein [Acidobacteriaceae bacterium]|nr:alpha/beta hydrolase-fold protein [Acidobacteriaceae bacterium]
MKGARYVSLLTVLFVFATGCSEGPSTALPAAGVRVFDSTVHSTILGRNLPIRIAMPEHIAPGEKLPVVYLLHGYASNYTSFSSWSATDADLVPHGYILAMPEDPSGFYLNQRASNGRYEDYFLTEVIPAVSKLVPEAENDPAHRAVVGMSRGGYGAISIALRHPGTFAFAGGLNSALDISTRPFIWTELRESMRTNEALGKPGSKLRHKYDPFTLIRQASPSQAPFLFMAWSNDDDDNDDDKAFAAELTRRGFRHTVATVPGKHTWDATSLMMPELAQSLDACFHPAQPTSAAR